MNKITDEIFDKYVLLFENLLLIHNWVATDNHTKKENEMIQEYLPMFMESYKKIINRQTGNRSKYIKYHTMIHFSDNIYC